VILDKELISVSTGTQVCMSRHMYFRLQSNLLVSEIVMCGLLTCTADCKTVQSETQRHGIT
jgi:hypothetical protein